MAISETVEKETVQMMINIGQDAAGNTKTRGVSLGTLKTGVDVDLQQAFNIAEAIVPCLTRPLSTLRHTRVTSFSD